MQSSPPANRTMQRHLWTLAGCLAFIPGFIGIPLLFLPTILFLMVLGERQPALPQLAHHPCPPTTAWRERHIMSRRAKTLATLMSAASSGGGICLLNKQPPPETGTRPHHPCPDAVGAPLAGDMIS